jgi:hypothetical protein
LLVSRRLHFIWFLVFCLVLVVKVNFISTSPYHL